MCVVNPQKSDLNSKEKCNEDKKHQKFGKKTNRPKKASNVANVRWKKQQQYQKSD